MPPASWSTKNEYSRRIGAALELIDRNLGGDISLAGLAAVAHFSPFHFHRIFSALVGESPADYVRRLRLEKAAMRLAIEPSAKVTGIALDCGFSTSALFCRLFRARFGMSPTAWRAGGYENRNKRQAVRKNRKEAVLRPGYNVVDGSQTRERRMKMKNAPVVRIEDIPPLRVAYVKHMKGYEDGEGIGKAFQTLFCWAGPRGVATPEMKVLGLALDDPDITPKDKCRYYACLAVTERAEPQGEVGIMTLRPGKYAVGRFSGGGDIFKRAYAYMYGEWLPKSGWQPDDAPGFESYIGDPEGPPENPRFTFDLYVPVKPL